MSNLNDSFVIEDKSFSDLAIENFSVPASHKMKDLVELSNDDYERLSCLLPSEFYNCVFVGHKATDLDSIASAIGCAELYHGIAARASEVNSESDFALKYWDIAKPIPFLDAVKPDSRIVIVDHNQVKQCADGLKMSQLVGCIDHHAMQGNTISTSAPIHVDIKPWGSACTIVAHMFFRAKRKITRRTAGMLLSGILSDTLNLRSPTTTDHDRLAVALLAKLAEVSETNELARALFKAKSQELLRCTPHQLVRGDMKTFECRCPSGQAINISFAVIETTDMDGLVRIRDDLALELRALKKEENKDVAFLALVDIVNLNSELLLVGSRETHLAQAVFGGEIDPVTGLMHLNGLVSRKKDFIPPLGRAIAAGYNLPALSPEEAQSVEKEEFGEVALECGDHGCQTVRMPRVASSVDIAQRFVMTFSAVSEEVTQDGDENSVSSLTIACNVVDGDKDALNSPAEPVSANESTIQTLQTLKRSFPSDDETPSGLKPMKKVCSVPHLDRSASAPLIETLQDPSAAPFIQDQIREFLDALDLKNMKNLMKQFALPSKEEYDATIARISQGDDSSLKFLMMVVAHSFEKQEKEKEEMNGKDGKEKGNKPMAESL